MVPSEPLVLVLGLAMLLVSVGCLLEHMAATMPLLLRAAWAARGVDFNISSVFPLAISVQVRPVVTPPCSVVITPSRSPSACRCAP